MSALRNVARRLGHRRWFAAVVPLVVPVDRLVSRLSRGRLVALGLVPSLLITTVGRRTGQRRSNPLLYVRDGDSFVVVASNWGRRTPPAWALNLLADPTAWVTVAGGTHRVTGRRVDGPDRDRLWRLLLAQWPAYDAYVARAGGRDIPIFRLEPAD
jgi:deazaflavin-dependent oxidoreductase (nitroreductase family)